MTTKTLNNIDRCPHCSVANPFLGELWTQVVSAANGHNKRHWASFLCTKCGNVCLAAGPPNYGLNYGAPDKFFPTSKTAHEDIPETARKFLQQAFDTLHAPDAAAVMAGSAVDAMLKHHGYIDGSLYSRIDKALSDHLLTQGMADWAHNVRLGSNRPRHVDSDAPHVNSDEALQSVEFAEALGQFLFVLTARVERGLDASRGGKAQSHSSP